MLAALLRWEKPERALGLFFLYFPFVNCVFLLHLAAQQASETDNLRYILHGATPFICAQRPDSPTWHLVCSYYAITSRICLFPFIKKGVAGMEYQVVLKIDHADSEKCSVVLREIQKLLRRSQLNGDIRVSVNGGIVSEQAEERRHTQQLGDFVFLKYGEK
jgi:hypothetical protein